MGEEHKKLKNWWFYNELSAVLHGQGMQPMDIEYNMKVSAFGKLGMCDRLCGCRNKPGQLERDPGTNQLFDSHAAEGFWMFI